MSRFQDWKAAFGLLSILINRVELNGLAASFEQVIKNDVELTNAFIRLESIFQANKGTPKAEEREILVTLIEAYEEEYYPIKVVKSSEILKVKWNIYGFYH